MNNKETAVIGGGCFWCVEAVIQRLIGIESIEPGYTGGTVPGKPTYREICSGLTGHAEVVKIEFDTAILSYTDLLTVFMTTHDPTTLNQQGADKGTQYRSVIYYTSEKQKEIAKEVLVKMKDLYPSPIVTEIASLGDYYSAEKEHHDYYNNNTTQPYCQIVISPKIMKLKANYSHLLKKT